MTEYGDVKVNDGNGLFDNIGLCDSLIADCNNAVRYLVAGNAIQFCSLMVQMVQKLESLKKGIKSDIGKRDQTIHDLNDILDKMQAEKTGLPVDGGMNHAD